MLGTPGWQLQIKTREYVCPLQGVKVSPKFATKPRSFWKRSPDGTII